MGQKKMGREEEGLMRALAALGGGIASTGGPCGALTGGVILLGRVFGKAKPEEKDDPRMWKASYEFYRRFESEVAEPWGSVDCRRIAGVNWRDREEVRAFYRGEKRHQCAANTGKAARILGEVLEKYWDSGE